MSVGSLRMSGGFTVKEVLEGAKGRLIYGEWDGTFSGVSIDSRTIQSGQLFFAIQGKRFDGHEFFYEALEKGAAGAVVNVANHRIPANAEEEALLRKKVLIGVSDTTEALQGLAAFHRHRWGGPIIGITGTNGKTTTKEFLCKIMSGRFNVLKNEGNLNNHIGVPLTLFNLNAEHEVAILEMGISGPGELVPLAKITEPETGIITNVGPAHLEGLKSVSEVAQAKSDLLPGLRGGVAVLNKDNPYFSYLSTRSAVPVVSFGRHPDSDLGLQDIKERVNGVDFDLVARPSLFPGKKQPDWFLKSDRVRISMPVIGVHNAMNAAAAAAAAIVSGCSMEEVKAGLESSRSVGKRTEVLDWDGRTILNDSYNANPASMEAALSTLKVLGGGGDSKIQRVAVLGDMLDLGVSRDEWHRRLGQTVASSGATFLITLGELAGKIADGARDEGMPDQNIRVCSEPEEVAGILKQVTGKGDVVLVKGSRGIRMERIFDALGLEGEE